jgi:hypothetical protein
MAEAVKKALRLSRRAFSADGAQPMGSPAMASSIRLA